jgi:hypothetical protein
MEAELASMEAALHEAKRDLAELIAGKTTVEELIVKNGHISAALGTQMAGFIAANLVALLDEKGAENYIEMTGCTGSGIPVTVRVQRGLSPTPHEFRVMAEEEARRLRLVLEEIEVFGTANPGCGHTCARKAKDALGKMP